MQFAEVAGLFLGNVLVAIVVLSSWDNSCNKGGTCEPLIYVFAQLCRFRAGVVIIILTNI